MKVQAGKEKEEVEKEVEAEEKERGGGGGIGERGGGNKEKRRRIRKLTRMGNLPVYHYHSSVRYLSMYNYVFFMLLYVTAITVFRNANDENIIIHAVRVYAPVTGTERKI